MAEDRDPSGPPDTLGTVLQFMRTLWAVDHGLQTASKRMEATYGITGPQRLVVRIVGQFPGIGAKRLAGILHVHPSTLTGILKRLETRGVLERRGDPKDARRALFELTDRGREVDQLRTGTVEAAVRELLLAHPEKVEPARELLDALAATLGAHAPE
jgi:DNA-binding MarR family transcriptional regulator